MILYREISELMTLAGVVAKGGLCPQEKDLGLIKKAAFVVEKKTGQIKWVGPAQKIPRAFAKLIQKEISFKGKNLFPGFVESHTHLVFAGSRAGEFELRNQGVSYQEISARGGGILSTMRETRKAKPQELLRLSQKRVDRFTDQGVTTLEVKSGYALNHKDELKVLRIHQRLKGPRIVSTFLGAHAKPPEFSTHVEYLSYLERLLPIIRKEKLASRVDIFIEKGFFEAQDSLNYLKLAKELGFSLTIHGDQLSLSGGSELAAQLKAQSVDHAICVSASEIQKLAQACVVATLLPAADLYMKCAYPPARKLIEAGVPVALATDFNPGSSPTQDLSLVGLLARLEMKMTLPEVWAAYTVNAGAALGLGSEVGSLIAGQSADFFVSDFSWDQFFYSIGEHSVLSTYQRGRCL